MDTGCSLGWRLEWVVATHPGQVIGWLADTPCEQRGAVCGLKPQSTTQVGRLADTNPKAETRPVGGHTQK